MTRDAHRPVLFFDIDDTLIDHRLAEEGGAGQLFERHSTSFRAESVQAFVPDWQNASKKHLEEFLKGNISFAEQRIRRCREVAARPLTASVADLIFRDYLEACEAGWTVFEEVPSALESLKSRGVRLGVISNGNVEQQTGKLERMNLLRYFEPVLISESLGVAKPDRVIFQTAAARMGCSVEECVHAGDSLTADVQGALGAGMGAVWLDRLGGEPPPGTQAPLVQVGNLKELLDLPWFQ